MNSPHKLTDRAPARSVQLLLAIVLALGVGLSVPLAWVWIGSKLQGGNVNTVESTTAAVIFVGIVLTYLVILFVIGWFQSFGRGGDGRPPVRHPWNRSMRDEPYRPGSSRLSPIEAAFVFTAVLVTAAMMIWFFGFAGSPLPNPGQPLPPV